MCVYTLKHFLAFTQCDVIEKMLWRCVFGKTNFFFFTMNGERSRRPFSQSVVVVYGGTRGFYYIVLSLSLSLSGDVSRVFGPKLLSKHWAGFFFFFFSWGSSSCIAWAIWGAMKRVECKMPHQQHTHRERDAQAYNTREIFFFFFLFSFGVKTAGQGEDQKKQSLPPPENKNFFSENTHTHI